MNITTKRVASMVANSLDPQDDQRSTAGEIKIIDPCCGSGTALQTLAETLQKNTRHIITTYGVERSREQAERATQRLNHTLHSDIAKTTIANNAFEACFLNPPTAQEPGRNEHQFLMNCTKYLAPKGIMIYIATPQALLKSARYLSEHYGPIQVRKLPKPESESSSQMAVFAWRRETPMTDEGQQERLEQWAQGRHPNQQTLGKPKSKLMTLSNQGTREIMFARRDIEPADAIQQARSQGLWNRREIQAALWPDEPQEIQPLMPLRKGHLAMLVAAGLLNNMVIEQDGQRLIVKGRTSKNQTKTPNRGKRRDARRGLAGTHENHRHHPGPGAGRVRRAPGLKARPASPSRRTEKRE